MALTPNPNRLRGCESNTINRNGVIPFDTTKHIVSGGLFPTIRTQQVPVNAWPHGKVNKKPYILSENNCHHGVVFAMLKYVVQRVLEGNRSSSVAL